GPHVLALHAAVRDLAVRHRVLPRRRPRHGRPALDLAVHLGAARAARDRDARVARAVGRAGADARAQGRVACAMMRSVVVPADSAGARLDVFLASLVGDLSRSHIQRLIKDGHVLVDGKPAKANQPVKTGQSIALDAPAPADPTPKPEPLPLPILYQDADVIVVDKPAGMVVHPAAGHAGGTLVNALLHHVSDLSGIGGEKRPGIVHRLDRGTSGLMVVAKNDRAHEELARQFHDREVEKDYLALV